MVPQLPLEIVHEIASHVERSSTCLQDLWAMTMVSRSWYSALITSLYHKPELSRRKCNLFVQTICPSINAQSQNISLSSMVKQLDMSDVVFDDDQTLTARILQRLQGWLEVFVAPQTSFQ